jgi:hypothetical protein
LAFLADEANRVIISSDIEAPAKYKVGISIFGCIKAQLRIQAELNLNLDLKIKVSSPEFFLGAIPVLSTIPAGC